MDLEFTEASICEASIYTYAQTGTFADPTVRCFKAFFDLCTFVRFFLGVSRRFFFLQLRIKPIQGIRVTLHVWACVKYVPKQSIP